MRHRYIAILISILTFTGAWSTADARSSSGSLTGGQKEEKAVKPDTTNQPNFLYKYYQHKRENRTNQPQKKVNPEVAEKFLSVLTPMSIAPALVGIQQTFGVRDNEGNEYVRNNNDYFSLVPSVCYETSIGTLIAGNVREPWRTDSEFMPHQGPFTAFLYESPRTVRLFGQTSGKSFEQLNTTKNLRSLGNPQWDLWVYDNGYAAPESRRLEIDSTGGKKAGLMVWMIMRDGNSSADSIYPICVRHDVSLNGPADMMAPAELPKLPAGMIVIGGCFLIPDAKTPIQYRLAGIASLKDKKWHIYYPFVTEGKKVSDTQIPQNLIELDNENKPDGKVEMPEVETGNNDPKAEGDSTPSKKQDLELLQQQRLEKKQQQDERIQQEKHPQERKRPEEKKIQQVMENETETVKAKKCDCEGVPCKKHRKEGKLDPKCKDCKVTDPCDKHDKENKESKKSKGKNDE